MIEPTVLKDLHEKRMKTDLTYQLKERNLCPKCESLNSEVRNFDPIWRDGDVCCKDCGTRIRTFDAG